MRLLIRKFVKNAGIGIPPNGALSPFISSFCGALENVPNRTLPSVIIDSGASLTFLEYNRYLENCKTLVSIIQ